MSDDERGKAHFGDCPGADEENSVTLEQNKEVAIAFVRSFSDLSGVSAEPLLSDTIWHRNMFTAENFPVAASHDKAGFLGLMTTLSDVIPGGLVHDVKSVVAEGDLVSIETQVEAVLADGRIYRQLCHFMFEVRDGQIEQMREYLDFLNVKEVLLRGAPH